MTCRGGVVSWGTKYRETGLIHLARCVACGVWRVACGVWRVACGVWRAPRPESRAQPWPVITKIRNTRVRNSTVFYRQVPAVRLEIFFPGCAYLAVDARTS
jgi:hypothetical protein